MARPPLARNEQIMKIFSNKNLNSFSNKNGGKPTYNTISVAAGASNLGGIRQYEVNNFENDTSITNISSIRKSPKPKNEGGKDSSF